MKSNNLLLIAGLGALAFFMFKKNEGVAGEIGGGRGSQSLNPTAWADEKTAILYNAKTKEQTPTSAPKEEILFKPTSENSPERFISANPYGVYDRYAQQSIRNEVATTRAIFGTTPQNTPNAVIPNQSQNQRTANPTIKALFTGEKPTSQPISIASPVNNANSSNTTTFNGKTYTPYIPKGVTVKTVPKEQSIAYKMGYIK